MDWEMHLYVERMVGEEWRPVCPPLATRPKARPKWGRYEPTDPVESLASVLGGTDFVPSRAPRWDFGPHPDGMQQLAALFTNIWSTGADVDETIGKLDPFLDPCGLPANVSPQVRRAGAECGMSEANAIWYTLQELNNHIFAQRQDTTNLPSKRVVALRDEMVRVAAAAYPDVCTCSRPNCYHRHRLIRAVVWSARVKKQKKKGG